MRFGRISTAVSGFIVCSRATSFICQKLASDMKIARSSALCVGFRMPTTVNGYSAISSPSEKRSPMRSPVLRAASVPSSASKAGASGASS